MVHKCFISFKTQDHDYKRYIHDHLDVDMIDKSLHEPIDSEDEDYIMRKIRENYLADSTVTIHLIGSASAENSFLQNQNFIKRELQASLYNGANNTKNGILGVVLPSMISSIYLGTNSCFTCGGSHSIVKIDDQTVVKEFSYNYYIPNNKCCWSEDDRYCVLTSWDEFCKTPNYYIDNAFGKRSHAISAYTRVRP